MTVAVTIPAGLFSPSETPSTGSYAGGTWTVGSLAAGASATLTISGYAGAVSDGTQTVTATATAATDDPVSTNNTASASEIPQPARLAAVITPNPNNPIQVDVSQSGDISWTGTATNAENPAAPIADPADYTVVWECETASTNPCPAVAGTDATNQPTLEYTISSLAVDTYSITLEVCPSDSNYVAGCSEDTISFTTVNSGG